MGRWRRGTASERFGARAAACAALGLAFASAPALAAGDADRDRVKDSADACPDTPSHGRVLLRGCSAVDVVLRPQRFTNPVSTRVDTALLDLGHPYPSLIRPLARLRVARTQLGLAGARMRDGEACAASAAYARAMSALRQAGTSMRTGLRPVAARLAELYPQPARGDMSELDLQLSGLQVVPAAVELALREARAQRSAFTGTCRLVLPRPLRVQSTVRSLQAGSGTVTLGHRTLAAALGLRGSLFQGGRASAKGIAFSDGTGVITSVEEKGGRGVERTKPPLTTACTALGIAPVQRPGHERLFDARGYERGGGMDLEEGMRLGITQSCPNSSKQGAAKTTVTSYGLRIALRYLPRDAADKKYREVVLASNLREYDGTVPLPADMTLYNGAYLTTTELAQTCETVTVPEPKTSCAAPVERGFKGHHTFFPRPNGSFAGATYERTSFALDTRPAGAFDATSVTAVASLSDKLVDESIPLSFSAEGYAVKDGASSRPNFGPIAQNQPFAIYADDPLPPELDAAEARARYGVDRPAGLLWPLAVGKRNGYDFAYTARLPSVGRDLLDECPDGVDSFGAPVPDSFLRLPFTAYTGKWWKLGQGNQDDPTAGHAAGQRYAFDFIRDEDNNGVGEDGGPIRAARGGTVVVLDNDETGNSTHPSADSDGKFTEQTAPNTTTTSYVGPKPVGYTGIGNYMWIRHDDGSYGVYFHFQAGSAKFKLGDRVKRGAVIAVTGNTGSSSTPHVHFEEIRADTLPTTPEQNNGRNITKHPVRFQEYGGVRCWLPRAGDKFVSNNLD